MSRSLVTEAVTVERRHPSPETQLADVTLKLCGTSSLTSGWASRVDAKIGRLETSDTQKIEFLHRAAAKLKRQKRSPLSLLENKKSGEILADRCRVDFYKRLPRFSG